MAAPNNNDLDLGTIEAVRAVLAGDNNAFAKIVTRYQGTILTVATVMLHDRQAAVEATQEVFVRAWQRLKSFDQSRPMKPWLIGIAHRVASDFQRLRALRAHKDRAASKMIRPIETPQPIDLLIRDEGSRMIWKLIDSLPPGEQMAVVLFYREGLSIQEVAESLGVSAGTVKTNLFRARAHLRVMLHEAGTNLEGNAP
jgi:RNA polymerase sigma-70 factor, ECF subfamily